VVVLIDGTTHGVRLFGFAVRRNPADRETPTPMCAGILNATSDFLNPDVNRYRDVATFNERPQSAVSCPRAFWVPMLGATPPE
jgi:hypothetical protein